MENIRPTIEQEHAIAMILSGRNVFLTGHAGTGKSTVLDLIKQVSGDRAAFLAPTGLAALNIRGSTMNSFFKLPPCVLAPDFVAFPNDILLEKIRRTDLFVIDEASMVRSDLLSAVDVLLKTAVSYEESLLTFGGKQVVVVGDFAQLPPVVKDWHTQDFLRTVFGGEYAFETDVWKTAEFTTARLTEVWRQSADYRFIKLLNLLRNVDSREGIDKIVRMVNSMIRIGHPSPDTTVLCPTRQQVDSINGIRDSIIRNKSRCFVGQIWGEFSEDMISTPIHLWLKIGSRVMVTANITTDADGGKCVNGDTGTVLGMDHDNCVVEVLLDNGRQVRISRYTWMNCNYVIKQDTLTGEEKLEQQIIGTYTQIPLKLAYALTVHKSQGLTLNNVHISLGNGMFVSGQLYTALSRARSLDKVSIDRPLHSTDVIFDPRVVEFCRAVDNTPPPPALNEPGWIDMLFPKIRS